MRSPAGFHLAELSCGGSLEFGRSCDTGPGGRDARRIMRSSRREETRVTRVAVWVWRVGRVTWPEVQNYHQLQKIGHTYSQKIITPLLSSQVVRLGTSVVHRTRRASHIEHAS